MLERTTVLLRILELATSYFTADEKVAWLEFMGINDDTSIYDLECVEEWLNELTEEEREKLYERIGEMFHNNVEELANTINEMFYHGEHYCNMIN